MCKFTSIETGSTVTLTGLKATQYNGIVGVVQSSNAEGRLHVSLPSGKVIAVLEKNLTLVDVAKGDKLGNSSDEDASDLEEQVKKVKKTKAQKKREKKQQQKLSTRVAFDDNYVAPASDSVFVRLPSDNGMEEDHVSSEDEEQEPEVEEEITKKKKKKKNKKKKKDDLEEFLQELTAADAKNQDIKVPEMDEKVASPKIKQTKTFGKQAPPQAPPTADELASMMEVLGNKDKEAKSAKLATHEDLFNTKEQSLVTEKEFTDMGRQGVKDDNRKQGGIGSSIARSAHTAGDKKRIKP